MEEGQDALTFQSAKVSWVTAEFVQQPPAWMPRAFVYGLLVTLFASAAYASVAKVAVHIAAHGALLSDPPIMPVVVPLSLKVAKLYVKEEQKVALGEPLIAPQAQVSSTALTRLRQTIEEIHLICAQHRRGHCADCKRRLLRVDQAALAIADVPELEAALGPGRDALARLLNAFAQYDRFDAVTASARRLVKVNQGKIKAVKRLDAEPLLRQELEQLTNEIVASQSQIADRRQALDESIARARDELETRLNGTLSALEVYRSQREILAPVAGVIHQLSVSGPGQFVSAGTEIMQVVPDGAKLIAALSVANRDIASLHAGLPVVIRLDAFPEREYGAVTGVVQSVPLAASISDAGAQANYLVLVRLDRQTMEKAHEKQPLRIGMQLEGRIISRYESMLTSILRRLFGIADSVTG